MAHTRWHKLYTAEVAAPPEVLFDLISDLPNYPRWLPPSAVYSHTTADPYPVGLGTRYHDGKPDKPGQDWWGTVTGFRPPGAIDFHHVIAVKQLRTTIDVHIHYSFEPEAGRTRMARWLVLDLTMPAAALPLRPLLTRRFDAENRRALAAVTQYAEAHPARAATPGAAAAAESSN